MRARSTATTVARTGLGALCTIKVQVSSTLISTPSKTLAFPHFSTHYYPAL
jgi:hypothetical protein